MNKPVINQEDQVAKTVGRTSAITTDYDRLVDLAESIMPRLPFPKGVYRFRSFEEADKWTNQHILQAARAKRLGHQG